MMVPTLQARASAGSAYGSTVSAFEVLPRVVHHLTADSGVLNAPTASTPKMDEFRSPLLGQWFVCVSSRSQKDEEQGLTDLHKRLVVWRPKFGPAGAWLLYLFRSIAPLLPRLSLVAAAFAALWKWIKP